MNLSTPRRILILGARMAPGDVLARLLREAGHEILCATRKAPPPSTDPSFRWIRNAQKSSKDARHLLREDADLILLCERSEEKKVGPHGEPTLSALKKSTVVNFLFPTRLALEAAKRGKSIEIVAVGSAAGAIAPVFEPLGRTTEEALRRFVLHTGPILKESGVTLRHFRFGSMRGTAARAPSLRLGEEAARRWEILRNAAPDPERAAIPFLRWLNGEATLGGGPPRGAIREWIRRLPLLRGGGSGDLLLAWRRDSKAEFFDERKEKEKKGRSPHSPEAEPEETKGG